MRDPGASGLGELYRLLSQEPSFQLCYEARSILELREGATVLLRLDPRDFPWLNAQRPLFATRALKVVLWAGQDFDGELFKAAPDFADWISHVLVCDATPRFVLRKLRAAFESSASVVWRGADLERALRESGFTWTNAEDRGAGPVDWLLWRGIDEPAALEKVRWELEHHPHRAILDAPSLFVPGWRTITDRVYRWDDAVLRLVEAGIEAGEAPTLAALVDLEPEAIERLLQLHAEGERDATLLDWAHSGGLSKEETLPALIASLELDEEARQALPRLGVLHGGAFEVELLAVTALGDTWPALRTRLETAGLLELEVIPGIIHSFVRFIPTLAPWLRSLLGDEARLQLGTTHRARYAALAGALCEENLRNPERARAVARREMPNLLFAAHSALDVGEPEAAELADRVNGFLGVLGLRKEGERLVARAQAAATEEGSRAWYLAQSNRGEQLLDQGRTDEAAGVFRGILERLGGEPSLQRAETLTRLGRCFRVGGRPDRAADAAREALALCGDLGQGDDVKRQRALSQGTLADALMDQGRFSEAREAYEKALTVLDETQDIGTRGVIQIQLGTLALRESDTGEALRRYQEALSLFQRLRDPKNEAVVWHQLGMAFEKGGQWDEAGQHYREAARIKEELGLVSGSNGAAATWTQLATLMMRSGHPEAAETWYRKAIETFRSGEDAVNLGLSLCNLAEAREHRLLARKTQAAYPDTRRQLRQYALLVHDTVQAVLDPGQRPSIDALLTRYDEVGCKGLVPAVRRLLEGERDEGSLFSGLGPDDTMILHAVLQGLDDPNTVQDLLSEEGLTRS